MARLPPVPRPVVLPPRLSTGDIVIGGSGISSSGGSGVSGSSGAVSIQSGDGSSINLTSKDATSGNLQVSQTTINGTGTTTIKFDNGTDVLTLSKVTGALDIVVNAAGGNDTINGAGGPNQVLDLTQIIGGKDIASFVTSTIIADSKAASGFDTVLTIKGANATATVTLTNATTSVTDLIASHSIIS